MKEEIILKLKKYDQMHLIKFYDELKETEKNYIENQIEKIDFDQVDKLYETTKEEKKYSDKIEPMKYIDKYKLSEDERKHYAQIGDEIIKNGEYAVATMAGGQGTRLGHIGPKGTFELIDGKSLFEIFSDEMKKANKKYGVVIPWYIMTSEENNDETVNFFEEKKYFGYPKNYIKFFKQGKLPMIDTKGKILLESKWKIKEAADGNGGIFRSMIKYNILDEIKQNNIKWLFIGSIDNAILKMVDNIFLGLTQEKKMLAASKTVSKANPHEKVGVFCKRNGKPSVIEYSELPEEMATMRDEYGELFYGEAHIMCNLFNTSILEKIGKENLPYHVAFKKSSYIDGDGNLIEPDEPNAFKFESFIFDSFAKLNDILLMRAKREEEFAPVKNKEGVDSPETARELYLKNK